MLVIDPVLCKTVDQECFQAGIKTSEFRGSNCLGQPGPEAQGARLYSNGRAVFEYRFVVATSFVQRIGEMMMRSGIVSVGFYGGLETRNCGIQFPLVVKHNRFVVQRLRIPRVDRQRAVVRIDRLLRFAQRITNNTEVIPGVLVARIQFYRLVIFQQCLFITSRVAIGVTEV